MIETPLNVARPTPRDQVLHASSWVRERWVPIGCLAGFAAVYLTLSLWTLPRFDRFTDTASYTQLSFLGHTERLWTVPAFYSLAQSDTGRVVAQSVVGAGCWICLAVQVALTVRATALRYLAAAVLFLMALGAPLLQWNRVLLSESLAISLTVLLFAAALGFARHRDVRRLAWLLAVVVLWAFTSQPQALVVVALGLPLAVLALRREVRRIALAGLIGVLVIGVWGAVISLRSGATATTATSVASIVQFRASDDVGELTYLLDHGMPVSRGLAPSPPLTASGDPVGVGQFGAPYADSELVTDPVWSNWAVHHGESVIFGYLIRHPGQTIAQGLEHSPQLMTMDPDYGPGPALPRWATTVVYGSTAVRGTAFSGGGAASSDDPIYLDVLLVIAAALLVVAAIRRKLSAASWVAVVALLLAALLGIEIWSAVAQELPRLFIPAAVLVHVALVTLIATCVDAFIRPAADHPAEGLL